MAKGSSGRTGSAQDFVQAVRLTIPQVVGEALALIAWSTEKEKVPAQHSGRWRFADRHAHARSRGFWPYSAGAPPNSGFASDDIMGHPTGQFLASLHVSVLRTVTGWDMLLLTDSKVRDPDPEDYLFPPELGVTNAEVARRHREGQANARPRPWRLPILEFWRTDAVKTIQERLDRMKL